MCRLWLLYRTKEVHREVHLWSGEVTKVHGCSWGWLAQGSLWMQGADGAVKVMRYNSGMEYPFRWESKGSYSVWGGFGGTEVHLWYL